MIVILEEQGRAGVCVYVCGRALVMVVMMLLLVVVVMKMIKKV